MLEEANLRFWNLESDLFTPRTALDLKPAICRSWDLGSRESAKVPPTQPGIAGPGILDRRKERICLPSRSCAVAVGICESGNLGMCPEFLGGMACGNLGMLYFAIYMTLARAGSTDWKTLRARATLYVDMGTSSGPQHGLEYLWLHSCSRWKLAPKERSWCMQMQGWACHHKTCS